jgi:hypothetical protein
VASIRSGLPGEQVANGLAKQPTERRFGVRVYPKLGDGLQYRAETVSYRRAAGMRGFRQECAGNGHSPEPKP